MAKFTYKYPHPAVATDCVVFGFDGRELKVLLIERGVAPFKGMWAFPGGFMRMDETAEECVLRELREETGLTLHNVRQLGVFSGVNRDPRERVVSIAFYSLARHSEVRCGDDASGARWWPLAEVPQLAFDHDYILRQAMQRIRQDIHFEPISFDLLEEEFTIADLQRLYECILGIRFDRRNFYRKIMQTGILKEVGQEQPETYSARPAREERHYGTHGEMRTRSIDDLFASAGPGRKAQSSPQLLSDTEHDTEVPPLSIGSDEYSVCCDNAMPLFMAERTERGEQPEAYRPHTPGRKGKLFRFDKESYDRMKENGNFSLEF